MAGVLSQALSFSELLSRRGCDQRFTNVNNELSCCLVFSPGSASGGVRNLLVFKESRNAVLVNGQINRKKSCRDLLKVAGWCRDWGWTSVRKNREIRSVLGNDDDHRNYSRGYEDSSTDGTVKSNSEGVTSCKGTVNNRVSFNEKTTDGQLEVEERSQNTGSPEWIQVDEQRNWEKYDSGNTRELRNGSLEEIYAWKRVSRGARNEEYGQMIDPTAEAEMYTEFMDDCRDSSNLFTAYETQKEKTLKLSRETRETVGGRSLGPFERGTEGVLRYNEQLGSGGGGDRLGEISNYPESFEDLEDERLNDLEGEKLRYNNQRWRESNRYPVVRIPKQGDSSTSGLERTVGQVVKDDQRLDNPNGKWGRASTILDARAGLQRSARYEVTEVNQDGELDEVAPKRESVQRERSTSYSRKEIDQRVFTRGALYAKQVISQGTAQNLGFVTQLWVDMESMKVVVLEVRQTLLFGEVEGFLLENLSKVGDVVLIYDENALLETPNLSNCSNLVGSDLLTENGFYLGKVRDYDFSLEDGTVLSLEFDTFGVPLIPSSVVSTYYLTVDEVIEVEEDSLLLKTGAEKRVQKLTKGLFSRTKQPYLGRRSFPKQKQKKVPKLARSRDEYGKGADVKYSHRSMIQPDERVCDAIDKDEYYSEPTVSGGKQFQEERMHLRDRREIGKSAVAESDPVEDLGRASTRNLDSTPQEIDSFQISQPFKRRVSTKESNDIPETTQSQVSGGSTTPASRLYGRRLPMSY